MHWKQDLKSKLSAGRLHSTSLSLFCWWQMCQQQDAGPGTQAERHHFHRNCNDMNPNARKSWGSIKRGNPGSTAACHVDSHILVLFFQLCCFTAGPKAELWG